MPATYQKTNGAYVSITGKAMAKPGRPCKRETALTALIGYLEEGLNYNDAARQCGASRPSLHRWMRSDPGFRFNIMLAREVGKRAPYWDDDSEFGIKD